MCGETMRLGKRQTTDRVPGTNQTRSHSFLEWTCPECDYFEEADEGTPEE